MIFWYRLLYQVIKPIDPTLDLSHSLPSLSHSCPTQGNGTTPHHVYHPPAVYMVMSSTVFAVICLGVVIILAFLFGGLVYFYCTRWDIIVFHEGERGVSLLSKNWTLSHYHYCLYTHSRAHDWQFLSCSWLAKIFLPSPFLLPQTFANVCSFVPLCVSLGLEITTSTALQQLCATLLYRFAPLWYCHSSTVLVSAPLS